MPRSAFTRYGRLSTQLSAAALFLVCASGQADALCGDVGGDGWIRASDALSALQLGVSGDYDPRADVGLLPDGILSATDAFELLKAGVQGGIPPCAAAVAVRAVGSTASFDFSTGGIAEFDVTENTVVSHQLGFAAGDSVMRETGGRVFVVNRFGSNNIQELDGSLATLKQCSVGSGANPHDIVLHSAGKAYVTLYDRPGLAVVDPSVDATCAGFLMDFIDLSPYADADGIPEMDKMALVGDRLFVSLQLLDRANFFQPTGTGALVVVDTDTDSVIATVDLAIANPFSQTKGIVHDAHQGRLYVGGPGVFFTDLEDGGIEIVDPSTLTSLGVVIDGAELGGDLTDFVMVGADRGYAIVAGEDFVASLVEFDVVTRTVVDTLATSELLLSDIEMTETGILCLADRDIRLPGLRCFDISDNSELTAEPLNPGLGPFTFTFVP